MMLEDNLHSRRGFVRSLAIVGGGLIATGCTSSGVEKSDAPSMKPAETEEAVSPPEDLMREHGVLRRVLLIYGEVLRRMEAREVFPTPSLVDAATVIRNFVEDYHEKLEEDYLFPRFEKANKLMDLVAILRVQHERGRGLTDITMALANERALNNPVDRARLGDSLRLFIRMYNPHAAREDTVLFPAFHGIVSPHEFDALGDEFEKKENQLFGQEGFERMVDKVAGIEKTLNIYDLAQFTPPV
jgi:hemerythrin-like domain-containing protein